MIQQALCPVVVGRDDELSALEDVVLAAVGGEGTAAVLAGDAGLGKTRLCVELRARASRLGCEVLWGSCSEDELSLSYLPIVEALGNRLGASDRASVVEAIGAATARDLAQILPQLAPDAASGDAADAPQARVRLYEAVLALLGVLGGSRPTLLVIDDLHWADTATCELVDYLMRRIRRMRVALVVTSRKDELGRDHPVLARLRGWQRTGLAAWVELSPLPSDAVGDMVGAIFDERSVSEEFQRLLFERSEGNPFVLEEMLKEAIDRGDIHRDRDGGWARREIDEITLPRTVADTILLRVERLGAQDVAILEAASAIGRSFSTELLATVSAVAAAEVEAATAAGIREQLLERDPASAGHIRFRHALTRQALYESLLPSRRIALHGRVAAALEADGAVPPVEVAHHLLAAGRTDDAVPLCIAAAEDATRRYAADEAADLYTRCLPHVRDPERRGRVLCRLGEALQLASDPERGLGHLREGIDLLERAGASLEAARHRIALGRCLWEREQPEVAAAEFERARATLEPAGPSADLARVYIRLAGVRVMAYEAVEAQALATRAVDVATAAGATAERIWALTYLGLSHLHAGRVAEGISLVDRSHEEALVAGLRWIADTSLINSLAARMLAWRFGEMADRVPRLRALSDGSLRDLMVATFETHARVAAADLDAAERTVHDYLDRAREMGHAGYEVAARNRLAEVLIEQGRFDEARQILPTEVDEREDLANLWRNQMRLELGAGGTEEAAEVADRVLDAQGWAVPPWLTETAVEAFLAAGRRIDAEAVVADRGLPIHAPASHALLDRALGRMALAAGDAARAIELLTAAARILAADGAVLEELRTLVPLATAYARAGNPRAATAHLRRVAAAARAGGAEVVVADAVAAAAAAGLDLTADPAPSATSGATPADAGASTALPLSGGSAGDGAVGGEERLVTVMFADVRGYTALSRESAPHDLAERITTFQRWAAREVARRGGMVDKFAGDAVMATFNVARTALDHPVQALETAMTLCQRSGLIGLPVGVGIAVGPAVVGRLVAGANVSVLGDTTNLAARLQASAGAGEVLLSSEAHRRTAPWFAQRGLLPEPVSLELKGIAGPVRAFRVAARAGEPTP